MSSEGGYRPIGDYALIGDTRTAALVARDGAIDWCCWPRFDAPAVFCRLLDARKGGHFRVGPIGRHASARSYVADTNILTTTFKTDGGAVRVTDFMPIASTHQAVLRLVEALAGDMHIEVGFRPTFDYSGAATVLTARPGGAIARGCGETLAIKCPGKLGRSADGGLSARLRVRAGRRYWVTLAGGENVLSDGDADAALAQTLRRWETWSTAGTYEGPHAEHVRRSALTLKLLTFEHTGALVAAPTTSLPEEIGGVRNWDYRFTWLRDAALALYALMTIGYHGETTAFFDWLERLCVRCRERLQIVYRLDGSPDLPETTLDHLDGYRGSRPVRVGNGAASQTQLDVCGGVLDAAHLCYEAMRRPFSADFAAVLRSLADQAVARWREPDHGIWEVRGGPRHFLYSKLLCWVALDRVLRLSEAGALEGDQTRWRRTREAIRSAILTHGYDARLGAFTQTIGEPVLDASALAIPILGFLPASDTRVRSTVDRIRERLTAAGLVYRYLADDGLPGGEATFVLCSFWLVDNLALQGRTDEAHELFERVVRYANDLGLLSEEIDPSSGALLGNYPQGFSHLALIRSALHIAKAEASGPEQRAETPAERVQTTLQARTRRRAQ